mmetsp:Transcript_28787/g.86395  ORF Transcript_28787/g.86395 Transcript_28787/m.86395 type:complete len:218 (+) Transcript_28787:5109-5762(+)
MVSNQKISRERPLCEYRREIALNNFRPAFLAFLFPHLLCQARFLFVGLCHLVTKPYQFACPLWERLFRDPRHSHIDTVGQFEPELLVPNISVLLVQLVELALFKEEHSVPELALDAPILVLKIGEWLRITAHLTRPPLGSPRRHPQRRRVVPRLAHPDARSIANVFKPLVPILHGLGEHSVAPRRLVGEPGNRCGCGQSGTARGGWRGDWSRGARRR